MCIRDRCSWGSVFWNVLAWTNVVVNGGRVKFLVANSAVEGVVWKVNSPVLGSTRSRNFCRKSMPKIFSLNSSAICTVCVHFLFFYKNVCSTLFCFIFCFAECRFESINVHTSNRRPCVNFPIKVFPIYCTDDFRVFVVPIKTVSYTHLTLPTILRV